MRIAPFIFSVLLFLAAFGCQKKEETTTRIQQVTEPPATSQDDSTNSSDTSTDELNSESSDSEEQGGRGMMGRGQGMGHGRGMGRGPGAMGDMRGDMQTLHAMFARRDEIKRTVKNTSNGAEATTESDDEEVASLIQEHVPAMEGRVLENKPLPPMTFHPIFVELIKHSDEYTLDYEETDKGVKVKYASDDPYTVMLVQEHAKLVSRFIKNGMAEIHNPYTLPEFDEAPLTSQADAPKARAIAAKEELFKRLSGRLTKVMQSEGPAAAIEVCSHEASQIAKAVGEEHGVTIGRTAVRLRNPSNKAPNWVKSLIKKPAAGPQFVNLDDGQTGALFPIKLAAKCVACHGPTNQISEEVSTQLAKLYPADQATGFNEGDLRGWFWVEVKN